MTRRSIKTLLWIVLAVAAIAVVPPARAQDSTNVVPNPGFEQGGCGTSTPDICGWGADPSILQDTTDPHSGSASMEADCGPGGCSGWDIGATAFGAISTVCVAIGPGLHPASFWYRDANSYGVEMDAGFFQTADCTGSGTYTSLFASVDATGGWHQVAGAVLAPPGTQSVLLGILADAACGDYCWASANFDDLDLETAVLTTPYIVSLAPGAGLVGDSVDIHGANLTGATSLTFNGTAASFTVDSDQEIHATVPPGATTGPISVTTPSGTSTSLAAFDVLPPPPTISSFTPTSGPVGTIVDIHGSNFSDVVSVKFKNSFQPTEFTVDSDSEIHATVPADAVTGPISVTNISGTGSSASSFTVPLPTVSSLTPSSGPVGTVVDIHGSNLTAVTYLSFNGGPFAQFTIDSDSEIHTTVPCGSWPGQVVLVTASGNGSPSGPSFTVTAPPPAISSFTPTSGPVGTEVDIQGSNLCGAIPSFNGTPANSWTLGPSDSEVRGWVPVGATSGPISVTTPGGTATSAGSFTVGTAPPAINSFTPTSGPVGTSVDIMGANFAGATSVKFNGTPDPSFVVNSPSDITAHVPTGATTGSISVTTPGGITSSAGAFTVTGPPAISSFTPTMGPVGTPVDIKGANLTGATSVKFNGTADLSFVVNSATDITAHVPTGASTGPISVTTPLGTATSAGSFMVAPPPPAINSFTPTSGPVGTPVDITGANFTGATSVKFNGTADPSFVVNSPTDLTAHVPTGATTGPISVTTPGGTVTSFLSFTVFPPPTITGFSPGAGHIGQLVTITGSNFAGVTSAKLGMASAVFTVISSTQLNATVPSIARGFYKWSLTSPGGTATSSSSFHVR